MIDLEPEIIDQLLTTIKSIILQRNIEIILFGSRTQNNAKKYSDIDIVLKSANKIEPGKIDQIRDLFSDSDIPFMIDISDWHELPDFLKETIVKSGVKIS